MWVKDDWIRDMSKGYPMSLNIGHGWYRSGQRQSLCCDWSRRAGHCALIGWEWLVSSVQWTLVSRPDVPSHNLTPTLTHPAQPERKLTRHKTSQHAVKLLYINLHSHKARYPLIRWFAPILMRLFLKSITRGLVIMILLPESADCSLQAALQRCTGRLAQTLATAED